MFVYTRLGGLDGTVVVGEIIARRLLSLYSGVEINHVSAKLFTECPCFNSKEKKEKTIKI